MKPPLLQIEALVKRFGALTATDHVDLDIKPGEIHALIGPNGAGKTTLINQITGEIQPDAGRINFDGVDLNGLPVHRRTALGMGRTFQVTNIFRNFKVIENVSLAVQAVSGHSFRFWRNVSRETGLREKSMHLLDRVGLADHAQTKASELAYGDQRKVGIAMAIAAKPRLLLLDEPMAGMGPEAVSEMVDLLDSLKGRHALLLIEHDVDVVFSLADRISVLVYGQIIATGTPAQIRCHAGVKEAYLGEGEV
jgi:branched-chain amino acid transport system ATP-binding protein